MALFIIPVILVLFLGHAVAYQAFVLIFPVIASQHLTTIRIVFVILMLSFLLSSVISHYYDSVFSRIFYTISAIWMGFLFYIFLAAVLYGIIFLIMHFISPAISILWVGKILILLAILVGSWGIYHAQDTKITRLTVSLPNLPEEWKGRKAVFLADTHLGQINGEKFAEKIVGKIKELNPDIIFDGGDLYDGVKGDASQLIKPFSSLKPPYGYYFVTGNHEEYGDSASYNKAITEAGIHILNNETVLVGGVRIIGVDYEATRNPENFSKILKGLNIDSKMPSILIKHIPLDLPVAEAAGINLQLSGHTHRAQMFPLNLITDAVYKGYDYGLKKIGAMQVLVTDGVGTWGPPMRVGTNSEIVLITFE